MRRRKDIGTAHQRIDDHERLCRIMQKQTCDMIKELKGEVNGIKKIILIAGAGIISGLFTIVLMLLDK
jgi:hypothetical protein